MKAMVTGKVIAVNDSKDKDGKPEKTALIIQEGERYPDQIMNVMSICDELKEGSEYTFPVVVIPYMNKRTGKAGLIAVLDADGVE